MDSAHNAWVAGAYYVGKSYNNPKSGDVFILELTPAGDEKTEYLYASNGEDVPYAMTLGPATSNRAWITGKTCGDGFPTTDGMVHHMSHCGVFLLELENSGVQDLGMVFGGSDGDDEGDAIVPNGPNSVYIAGRVNSSDFPATQGAFQTLKTAGGQGFVTQIDGTSPPGKIVHSTLFGADGTTVPSGIANADGKGVYLSGYTSSIHLPGGPVLPPSPTAGFVTKFSVDLSQVRYTVIMNLNVDGIAVQNPVPGAPLIYATGLSTSNNNDAYVAKLDESTPTSSVTTLPMQVEGPSIPVSWSGTDPATPIARYDIYVSDNFGPFTAFQTGTSATSATFNGTLGHIYGFFSVATDGDGNREPMKSAPDTVVRDGPPPPVTITCTKCSFQNSGSQATLAFNVMTPANEGTFTFNNGNTAHTVQFAATDITSVSVTGNFATFSGDGTVNGSAGYRFTVSATDAGGPGSGKDTVLVQISGPNNFTYNAPATITRGDIVVH